MPGHRLYDIEVAPQWVATVIVASAERFAETAAGLWLAMER